MTKEKEVFRKVSPNERTYICYQDLFSTFAVQFVVEGNGEVDKELLSKAIKKVGVFFSGANLICDNKNWIKNKKDIVVKEVFSDKFDGYNFEVLDLFTKKIDNYKNSLSEVIIVHGNSGKVRIIFRVFHGIMDGKGVILWIENIFKELRGEKVVKESSPITDLGMLKTLDYKKKVKIPPLNKKIIDKREGNKELIIYTKRKQILGKHIGVVSKVAKVLTDTFIDKNNIFLIPTDIRRHDKKKILSGNLTLPIFLGTSKKDNWKDINKKLITSLQNKEELNINNAKLGIVSLFSDKMIKNLIKCFVRFSKLKNRYMIGGVISYLSGLDLSKYSCQGFETTTIYSIPTHTPLIPVSISILQNTQGLEIIGTAYTDIIPVDRMEEILEKIQDEITGRKKYENLYVVNNYEGKKNTLKQLLEESIENNKNEIALKCENEILTYKDLDMKVNDLAKLVHLKGVKKNDIVIILQGPSIEFIISVITSIKLGVVYIPMDINDYNQWAIEKGEYKVILTSKAIKKTLPLKVQEKVITYEEVSGIKNKLIVDENIQIDQEIYQIYTSGSTGTPKGVRINNDNLVNYLLWAKEEYQINSCNSFALFTSTSVDLTVTSYLLPLICGGNIEIFKGKINSIIVKEILMNPKIDCLKMTPTHLKIFEIVAKQVIEIPNKKQVIIGGENLDLQKVKVAYSLFGNCCRVINEYGPTEATIGCIFYDVPKNEKNKRVPIGKPISNTKILLLDKKQNLVYPGKIGEIYIAGRGIALGYVGNEKLTDEYFITVNGQKYYKTGDLASLNKDGNYVYLGRNDRQVKINGRRIELEGIESVIREHIEFKDVILLEVAQNTLGLFYVSNNVTDLKKLKDYISVNLPIYKRPKVYIKIDEFPMEKSGKLDIKFLLNLYKQKKIKASKTSEILYSDIELKLLKIWSKVLERKISSIDIEDYFLNLGGDSLSYIALVSELHDIVGKGREEKIIDSLNDNYDFLTIKKMKEIIQYI